MNPEHLQDLGSGWQIARTHCGATLGELQTLPPDAWLPASVPGSAHGALLAAGRIPDPFIAMHELQVQWVGECAWAWRLNFDAARQATHEDLVFEGLDTYVQVWLNGTCVLTGDNMFVPQRVAVRELLRTQGNELMLRFDPPLARAGEHQAQWGRRPLWNGDSARLYVRKAQYHFGWDWGPVLLTSGPWRPVRRHDWDLRIADLDCRPCVDASRRQARIDLCTHLAGDLSTPGLLVEHDLLDPDGQPVAGATLPAAAQTHAALTLEDARLWWPAGMGAQPLYTLVTRVVAGGRTLAQDQRRIGLRELRLVQEPVAGEPGSSFYFQVNGRAFFAGGANWIPEDNLLERVTPARYRERVAQAVAAHMTMLRVWGGGIYEDDAFYDACDELGVLVWQDFMFACGMYPAHAAFQASVRAEAAAAVRRLRHRACLALWCGNNEDYAIAESVQAYGPGSQPGRFDARELYEHLLPDVCAELDPGRPYWPGSPFTPDGNGVRSSSDPTAGDRHSWEVWHQQMLPYQQYHEVQGRFVSEFGMQSCPSLALLQAVLPDAERYPESRTMAWHNKSGSGAPDGHRRLAVYLSDNLRAGTTLADHVYATQFVQAEAMRYAYQDFRRRWQRPGARAVGGALVWQLNDCWPATSWALIDSSGRVKPAWQAVRRALAPLAVALRWAEGGARAAVMNALPGPLWLRLRLRMYTLDGRCLHDETRAHLADGGCSCELDFALPTFGVPVVGHLQAQPPADAGAPAPAEDCAWPEPFKFHSLGGARIELAWSGRSLSISADAPVKGLWIDAGQAIADDNFIDLVPGVTRDVSFEGDLPATLRIRALDHGPRILGRP